MRWLDIEWFEATGVTDTDTRTVRLKHLSMLVRMYVSHVCIQMHADLTSHERLPRRAQDARVAGHKSTGRDDDEAYAPKPALRGRSWSFHGDVNMSVSKSAYSGGGHKSERARCGIMLLYMLCVYVTWYLSS